MTDENISITLLDNDKNFCLNVAEYLRPKGCRVTQTFYAQEFKEKIITLSPDIVLINEKISGFELIKFIRLDKDIKNLPIIVLSSCLHVNDSLQALYLGADDLLCKPVSMEELYARILANLRRSTHYLSDDHIVEYGDLRINLKSHQVYIKDQYIALTSIEYRLLYEMITNKGEILYRDRLAHKFLTLRNNSSRTLDVHITSLRKKLGDFSSNIRTVRGRGYMLQYGEEKAPSYLQNFTLRES